MYIYIYLYIYIYIFIHTPLSLSRARALNAHLLPLSIDASILLRRVCSPRGMSTGNFGIDNFVFGIDNFRHFFLGAERTRPGKVQCLSATFVATDGSTNTQNGSTNTPTLVPTNDSPTRQWGMLRFSTFGCDSA